MLDLTKYEGKDEYAELVKELTRLREAGGKLADVASMVAAERDPLNPDCIKCEHIDQQKAREALTAWRAI